MRAAGIAVKIVKKGRPTVRLVVLDDSSGSPSLEAVVAFPSDDADVPIQLHEAAEAVQSRLAGLAVDRVVVRRADPAKVASKFEGPQLRLLMEGAVVVAAKRIGADTRLVNSQKIGEWLGCSKHAADASAGALLSSSNQDAVFEEAAAAALAALSAP